MTDMTPSREELIADIRRVAIACNSEIVELKFGALVETKNWGLVKITRNGEDYVEYVLPNGQTGDEDTQIFFEQEMRAIIGRNITLADILLAISEKEMFRASQRLMTVSGCFYDNGLLLAQWNLRLPFEEQSDEVLLFIYGLVK